MWKSVVYCSFITEPPLSSCLITTMVLLISNYKLSLVLVFHVFHAANESKIKEDPQNKNLVVNQNPKISQLAAPPPVPKVPERSPATVPLQASDFQHLPIKTRGTGGRADNLSLHNVSFNSQLPDDNWIRTFNERTQQDVLTRIIAVMIKVADFGWIYEEQQQQQQTEF